MNVFAYCTAPARKSVARATGSEPFTSPPWSADVLSRDLLQGYDLLYFRLHAPAENAGEWWGERLEGGYLVALRVEQLQGLELITRPAVLIANCYGAGSPFVPAFYAAGARAVIAAPGPNYAAGDKVLGADLVALWLIRLMGVGLSVGRALTATKIRLTTTAWRAADRDALAFRIMEDRV